MKIHDLKRRGSIIPLKEERRRGEIRNNLWGGERREKTLSSPSCEDVLPGGKKKTMEGKEWL